MIISLNYAIFGVAILASADTHRRGSQYKDAATHLFLLGLAALLGGLTHHIEQVPELLKTTLAAINAELPPVFAFDNLYAIHTRLWFATFVAIGLTEYYFLRIFLHPIAERLGYKWIKPLLVCSLILFVLFAFFIRAYSLVVIFHLFTHLFVIGFALYLIAKKGLKVLWHLVGLAVFNLAAGAIWSAMMVNAIPTFSLHSNDWYHIFIIAFIVYLHWALTHGGLVSSLTNNTVPAGTAKTPQINSAIPST